MSAVAPLVSRANRPAVGLPEFGPVDIGLPNLSFEIPAADVRTAPPAGTAQKPEHRPPAAPWSTSASDQFLTPVETRQVPEPVHRGEEIPAVQVHADGSVARPVVRDTPVPTPAPTTTPTATRVPNAVAPQVAPAASVLRTTGSPSVPGPPPRVAVAHDQVPQAPPVGTQFLALRQDIPVQVAGATAPSGAVAQPSTIATGDSVARPSVVAAAGAVLHHGIAVDGRSALWPNAVAAGDPEPPRPQPAAPVVHIDHISVVTPPAQAPAPDPFGSLSARRSGHSRHGGRP